MPTDTMQNPFLEGIDLLKSDTWTEAHVTIREVIAPGHLRDESGKLLTLPTGEEITHPAIRYKGSEKIHILNKTNYTFMRILFGTEKTDEWVDRKVTLYAAAGDWFGEKNQCALRVRLPADRPIPKRFRAQLGRDLTGKKVTTAE